MGVNQLWNILEPVKRSESLSSLRNKTLCVDLSCWICEARCAKGLKQNVSKPHLRNLFFRLLHLTRLGVKLVFVVDGEPPELKWEAILRRIQARNAGQNWRTKNSQKTVTGHGSGARVRRSHFDVWVREVSLPFENNTSSRVLLTPMTNATWLWTQRGGSTTYVTFHRSRLDFSPSSTDKQLNQRFSPYICCCLFICSTVTYREGMYPMDIAFVIQMCQSQEQRTLCFGSQ